MVLFWTARQLRNRRWQFQDGWICDAEAQRAALFYRREFRRRCVVVRVPDGTDKAAALRAMLKGV